jgi:hypothetical protein
MVPVLVVVVDESVAAVVTPVSAIVSPLDKVDVVVE